MTDLRLSNHAVQRLAQRSIAATDIELIMAIGSEVPDGYLVCARDRQAIEESLKRLLERVRRLEGKRLVITEGCVVTAYHAERKVARRLLRGQRKIGTRRGGERPW